MKLKRQQLIIDRLRDDQPLTVGELSRYLKVSEVTIRRDLRQLAAQGLLRRVHGGAVLAISAPPEPPVVQRMVQAEACKECIGRAAAALVADGESVFIGSGSTTAYVARHLVDRRNLTVVTNALTVAMELATAEGVTVVVTGGVMRASELSLVGHIAELALREVRVDKVIMGMRAIDLKQGMTNDYLPEVMTDRTILEMAPELIVVADHTKLGKVATAYVAPVEQITVLVTDCGVDGYMIEHLRKTGIHVIIVNSERYSIDDNGLLHLPRGPAKG
jgi:DeoR/GlpR family transcriptional regulator of sugar metabolism